MLKKKIVDLLNQELDGTNGQKDSATVRRLLEKNTEAKQYYSDLQSIVSMFKEIPAAEPPTHLKKNILSALHFPIARPVVQPIRKPFFEGYFSGLGFRYASVFAGGAIAGILLFVLFTNVPSDSRNMVGTMASHPDAVAGASADLRLDQVTGTIVATQVNGTVAAELNLHSREEIDVIVNFDEHQLKFGSFEPEDNTRSIVTLLDGQVRLTLIGDHRYVISFMNESNTMPSLTAKVYAQGVLLSSYDLLLERKINH